MNKSTLIMGVINVTPDSFYKNSIFLNKNLYKKKLLDCKDADIVDIGAESSKPGSDPIGLEEEKERLGIVFDTVQNSSKVFSIDTYKPQIAELALSNGFTIVNDIYAGTNEAMFEVVYDYSAKIVLMHMLGDPKTMQLNIKYGSLIDNILSFFDLKLEIASKYGLSENQIILDPGIGFGKKLQDNFLIIKNIARFKKFGFPVLIGLSRKSFLSLENDLPEDRLSSTITANLMAMIYGADILRVHDVCEHKKMIDIYNKISNIN